MAPHFQFPSYATDSVYYTYKPAPIASQPFHQSQLPIVTLAHVE